MEGTLRAELQTIDDKIVIGANLESINKLVSNYKNNLQAIEQALITIQKKP